jgi:hypothetical protein
MVETFEQRHGAIFFVGLCAYRIAEDKEGGDFLSYANDMKRLSFL